MGLIQPRKKTIRKDVNNAYINKGTQYPYIRHCFWKGYGHVTDAQAEGDSLSGLNLGKIHVRSVGSEHRCLYKSS